MTPTGQAVGKKPYRRGAGAYAPAKALYVEGEPGRPVPGAPPGEPPPHVWPTMEVVAQRLGMGVHALRKRAQEDGWARERAMFAARLEREKRDAKIAKMASDAASFDSTTFRLAQALLGEVAQQIKDINTARKLRDMKLRAAEGDDAEVQRILTDPKQRPASAGTLSTLGFALTNAQRVGRLALGEATEVPGAQELLQRVEAEVKHSGTVAVDVYDYRQDPQQVASIARILAAAGVGSGQDAEGAGEAQGAAKGDPKAPQ